MRQPPRVLLVDDEWAQHQLIGGAIRTRFPHAVLVVVGSIAAALERSAREPFDVVLLDAGLAAGAEEEVSQLRAGESPPAVELVEVAPSRGKPAKPLRAAEIIQLVAQHLER